MTSTKTLRLGDVIVTGYAQLMQDGLWSAKCAITVHLGPYTDEKILTSADAFQSQNEAVSAALQMGRNWVDQHYPTR
jgi:hypothetical protein